ncbi:galactitol-1-phosphate 5-dehydrogenase [Georgenia sp. Z1344]|uniref:galactitol-1-phosphate 5-dehydrogenase n=1 Tax=Georgenia sp. Z1344 TaxID=3416706 RepID=UPI003CF03B3A
MTEKMKAVQLHAVGDVRLEEVEKPTPGPGEALLKVAACGVCGSDLDRMFKKGAHKLPLICGHEFSAWVEEIGEGVTEVAVGDLVTVPPMLPCFECGPCVAGHYSLCEDYDYYGSRRHGAYAEYVAGPAKLLLKVPADLDPRAAAMVDPSAIALHALLRTKLAPGKRVAVVGAGGPIGLFAIQWARLGGALDVLAVDVSPEKAELAREAGATTTATTPEAAAEAAGLGYDIVVECSGNPIAENQAVGLAARHGEVVLIGIPNADVTISDKNWARMMRLEIDIKGSWNSFSAPFPGTEWTTTVEAMHQGLLKWEFMITHELPLEKVGETIEAMYKRTIHSSKVLFLPHGA